MSLTPAGISAEGGCFPFAQPDNSDCQKVRAVLLNAIEDPRITTIIIANKWGGRTNLKEGLIDFSNLIQKRPDLKIYTILDAPWDQGATDGEQGTFDPLQHLYRLNKPVKELWIPLPKQTLWSTGNQIVTKILGANSKLINPYSFVCTEQLCNLRWYRDDDHLKPKLVESDGIWFDACFQ